MKNYILLFLCLLSIQCGKQEQSSVPTKNTPSRVDYSTPDKLIRSFWAFQVWKDTTYDRDTSYLIFYTSDVRTKLCSNYEKNIDELKASNFRLQNVISKVNVESESRAIVEVKEKGYPKQQGYSQIKYILAKENNNWRVEDVLELCWNCKGEGLDIDFSSPYPHSKSTCKYCDGLGWTSRIFPKPIDLK